MFYDDLCLSKEGVQLDWTVTSNNKNITLFIFDSHITILIGYSTPTTD